VAAVQAAGIEFPQRPLEAGERIGRPLVASPVCIPIPISVLARAARPVVSELTAGLSQGWRWVGRTSWARACYRQTQNQLRHRDGYALRVLGACDAVRPSLPAPRESGAATSDASSLHRPENLAAAPARKASRHCQPCCQPACMLPPVCGAIPAVCCAMCNHHVALRLWHHPYLSVPACHPGEICNFLKTSSRLGSSAMGWPSP
jgi:hypothetical protein